MIKVNLSNYEKDSIRLQNIFTPWEDQGNQ